MQYNKNLVCLIKGDNKSEFVTKYCTKVDFVVIAIGLLSLLIGFYSMMSSVPKRNKNNEKLKRTFTEKMYYVFGVFYTILSYFCLVYIILSYVSYLYPE